jgi:glycosyltransferase involved in cell wall biosynthesis
VRVLHVINTLRIGGAEKLIVDSIPIYQTKGVKADVLMLKDSPTPFYEKLNKKSNGKVFSLTQGSLYSPFLIFKIIPYLKKYDIIHIHLFPSLYWVVLAKLVSFSKVKLIYTEHSTQNRRRTTGFKLADKFIYNFLNQIVCITDGVKENLIKHIGKEHSISVINNGIMVNEYYLPNLLKQNTESKKRFTIIQVSSFRGAKDQATLIKSLLYLPENIELVLVGSGEDIENCKELTTVLKLSNRIKFLGNRYDVPELLNASDIVVLSSNHEGFGLVIVEGMAAKKPCIAANIEGVKEIVENYGLLFEKGNSKELANIILSLYNNTNFYNYVANKCFIRAKYFDIEKMVDSYISLYMNSK